MTARHFGRHATAPTDRAAPSVALSVIAAPCAARAMLIALPAALALAAGLAVALSAAPAGAQASHSAAATGTPPGLAKKGGVPPGQARKWAVGRRLPDGATYVVIDDPRRHGLPRLPDDQLYLQVDGEVLRVARTGLQVLGAVGAVSELLN